MAKLPTSNRSRNQAAPPDTPVAPSVKDGVEPTIHTHPANENDPGTAIMLKRLRRAPSYDVIIIAALISAIWVGGWFWVYRDIVAKQQISSPSEFLQAFALLVLPVFGMMTIAYFQWRAQQLRQTSEVLMHQAMRLIRPQNIATDDLTTIAQTVRQEIDLLVSGIEHAFQRATALEDIVHKEITAVERAFGSNEDRLRSLVNGLETQRTALQQTASMVGHDTQPVLSRLESNTQNLSQVINLALSTFGRLEDGLKSSTGELARTIEEVAQNAAQTGQHIGTHSAQFERMSTMLISDFRGFSNQFQDYIQTLNFTASTLGNETRKFGSEVKGMETSLLQILDQSTERLIDAHREVAQTVEHQSSTASNSARQSAAELIETFGQLGDSLSQRVKTISGDAALLIERVGHDTAQRIEKSNTVVTHSLQTVTADYIKQLSAARGELTDHVDQAAVRLTSEMDVAAGLFDEHFMQTGAKLVSHINQAGNSLLNRLDTSGSNITESLQVSAEKYTAVLGEAVAALDSTSKATSTQLANVSARVNDALVSTSGTIAAHLKETSEIVSRQMQDSGLALAQNIEASGGLVTDRLITVSGEFIDKFTATRDGLLSTFIDASGDLSGKLEDTSSKVNARLQDVAMQITDRLQTATKDVGKRLDLANDHLEMVASEIAQHLDGEGKRFGEVLNEASGRIFIDLGKARDAFSEGLGETTLKISGRLEQETGMLVSRIDKAAYEFDNAASHSTRKLDEAAKKFTMHMETTNGLLTDQLAAAAGDIDNRLASVSAHLTGKLELTSSRISERLEDVSVLVDKSVDKFNLEMEHMLQSRRDMLDNLVREANLRAGEADRSMAVYLSQIEESLLAAQARAQSISSIISDQSSAALGNLEAELRKLESNSTEQVAQAARALREQHERALTNMNEMLSSTASDFQQTAHDMRITAQQVVKDIDTARGELKRAVIDLPEETRNNADAMRRVVADQIGALNALADVVRNQTGTLDFSGPGVVAQRSPARAETAYREPARKPAPSASAPSTAMLALEIENFNTKLNASARDVVEAIEAQLPRDLEKRYGSDKSVYTMRLFESRSRKLIKSLESRYAEERLLRSRIQAYNRLFEKLLDSVSGGNDAEAMMEQVLSSEQGRIYVMLAEVAGRLPSRS